MQQDIANRKADKVMVINKILIWTLQAAYQVVIRIWLKLLNDENTFQIIIKKDIKVKKKILILLF